VCVCGLCGAAAELTWVSATGSLQAVAALGFRVVFFVLLVYVRTFQTLCFGGPHPLGPGPWPLGPLHSLFRPELYWWRLVLILRKFCIVGVALMFSSTPLFQAWCVPASVTRSQFWTFSTLHRQSGHRGNRGMCTHAPA
jgi:hypothetical protein